MPTNGTVATSGDVTPSAATASPFAKDLACSEKEVVRVIGQYLRDVGLNESYDALMKEASCDVEHPCATAFRNHILEGNFDEAIDTLADMQNKLKCKDDFPVLKVMLLEQKYLELLESGKRVEALKCLRGQIDKLGVGMERVKELSSFAVIPTAELLYKKSGWVGVRGMSRQMVLAKIQEHLPPDIMLPPQRLRILLQQSLDHQVDRCRFHNTSRKVCESDAGVSYLMDHACTEDQFPASCRQVCHGHTDEVWYCTWSADGLNMASCSKDNTVILWKLNIDTMELEKGKVLSGHRRGASFCAFSPDANYLLVCGGNDPQEARLWSVPDGEVKAQFRHNNDDCFTTCDWFPNSKRFVIASARGHFSLCTTSGTMLHTWDGVRVQSVAIPHTTPNPKWVLAADSLKRVRRYDFDAERVCDVITEEFNIMSMTASRDGQLVLINCANQGVHLWDVQDKCLVRRFRGVTQGQFTIYSCFGGVNQDFIASGSEDSKVYIFHKTREDPLCRLVGHSKTVNCVAWNPAYPSLLVSASDDECLRLWAPKEEEDSSHSQCQSDDDFSFSNGDTDSAATGDRLFSVAEVEGSPELDDD